MEATAKLRFARGSARKARLVLDTIRYKPVSEAVNILRFSQRRAAGIIYKLLESAVANARQQDPKIDLTKVFVSQAMADEGPQMKRFMPRAQGRAFMIRKQTCHISLGIQTLE
ncbi:MAG: 50S ribosomal protein L22 [Candidatus Cloacimonadaceae bacterium]|jgi:large subunit ribosomal protein L22|nr:50S ribosomal protein L22 [Candidatus Cloacimonadota bacterium]MDY0127491.1 50S ribosomal protein L22 [Candidatus Cloacimonadaceae bacterium]MCB5254693.1 50S ribosomal protein L22 [Candidatus Cloacimonadota bacterium]MCK9177948.1 50S ribosomal protein L22 [Candidatus Cloacimonadota bacterium]MCK9243395.1 50S ribosomal protein L22 [Candidatus Cloacimonadota bacterium]